MLSALNASLNNIIKCYLFLKFTGMESHSMNYLSLVFLSKFVYMLLPIAIVPSLALLCDIPLYAKLMFRNTSVHCSYFQPVSLWLGPLLFWLVSAKTIRVWTSLWLHVYITIHLFHSNVERQQSPSFIWIFTIIYYC